MACQSPSTTPFEPCKECGRFSPKNTRWLKPDDSNLCHNCLTFIYYLTTVSLLGKAHQNTTALCRQISQRSQSVYCNQALLCGFSKVIRERVLPLFDAVSGSQWSASLARRLANYLVGDSTDFGKTMALLDTSLTNSPFHLCRRCRSRSKRCRIFAQKLTSLGY